MDLRTDEYTQRELSKAELHRKETSEDSIVIPPHSLHFTVIDLILDLPIGCMSPG
jgi:hypothetical protein